MHVLVLAVGYGATGPVDRGSTFAVMAGVQERHLIHLVVDMRPPVALRWRWRNEPELVEGQLRSRRECEAEVSGDGLLDLVSVRVAADVDHVLSVEEVDAV